MENTKVVFREGSAYGEVRLYSDGKYAGRMDFSVADGKIRVYHTQVDPEYRGRGYSKLILHQLVSYTRGNNLMIIPICPYVLAQLKRHPEAYADIWLSKGL